MGHRWAFSLTLFMYTDHNAIKHNDQWLHTYWLIQNTHKLVPIGDHVTLAFWVFFFCLTLFWLSFFMSSAARRLYVLSSYRAGCRLRGLPWSSTIRACTHAHTHTPSILRGNTPIYAHTPKHPHTPTHLWYSQGDTHIHTCTHTRTGLEVGDVAILFRLGGKTPGLTFLSVANA